MNRAGIFVAAGAIALSTASVDAAPIELVTNGGFETGDFTGWTSNGTGSGNGFVFNDGTLDPSGSVGPTAPIAGSFDVVSTQSGPGLNTLLSDFIVLPTSITSATFSWLDRIQNSTVFQDPNQEFRVSIVDAALSTITTVFSTNAGDSNAVGPNARSFDVTGDLSGLGGQSVALFFEQQDNLFFFNVTLDNISLAVETSPVPLPAPAFLLLAGLGGLAAFGRKGRTSA